MKYYFLSVTTFIYSEEFLKKHWSDSPLVYFGVDALCPLEMRPISCVTVLNYFKLSVYLSLVSKLLNTNMLDYMLQVTEMGGYSACI